MKEHFLAFAWKHRLWHSTSLETTDRRPLKIENVGMENTDSGPDFNEAQIRIDGIIWNGSVEIHIKASDWLRHGHQNDPTYDKTILHVVYESDCEIHRTIGSTIPCLELKSLLNEDYWYNYDCLLKSHHWLACQKRFQSVEPLLRSFTVQKMAIERLEKKAEILLHRLEQLEGNWLQLSFERLLSGMGFKINSFAFEQVARRLDVRTIIRESYDIFRIEALLFGQCSMLSESHIDDYHTSLHQTYLFLQKKYNLTPVKPGLLKFLRTRPANFPTIRLAQLAAMFNRQPEIPQLLLDISNPRELKRYLSGTVSEYWQAHYNFNKKSRVSGHTISSQSSDLLLINVIAPLQMAYAIFHNDEDKKTKIISLLESIKSEKNKITRIWKQEGYDCSNALESQGLLHLKREYCDIRNCLNCSIGQHVVSTSKESQISFP
jgi:hypothetical protein